MTLMCNPSLPQRGRHADWQDGRRSHEDEQDGQIDQDKKTQQKWWVTQRSPWPCRLMTRDYGSVGVTVAEQGSCFMGRIH